MFVDNDHQCFAFTPQANFPAINLTFSLKVKLMGLIFFGEYYLLKYLALQLQFRIDFILSFQVACLFKVTLGCVLVKNVFDNIDF